MIGTAPIYDAVVYYHKPLIQITADEWIDIVRMHAEDGVDFMDHPLRDQPVSKNGAIRGSYTPWRRIDYLRVDGNDRKRKTRSSNARRDPRDLPEIRRDAKPRRRLPSRIHRRRHRRLPAVGAYRPGRAYEARPGRRTSRS